MLKIYSVVFLFFYLSISVSFAQKQTDSLWRVLKQQNLHDSSRVLAFAALSYEYRRVKPDSSLLLAQQSAEIARKINYTKGIGKADNMIGRYYLSKSDYNKALEYFTSAINFSMQVDDTLNIAIAYGNMGAANRGLGHYDKAISFYNKSLEIAKTINYRQGIAGSYSAIGVINKQEGNYEKALDAYFNALKIREELKDKQGIADSYNNLGHIYLEQENYEKALSFFHQVLKIREEIGDKQGIGDYYGSLGLLEQKQKNYEKALEAFFNSVKIREEIGDKRANIFMYSNIGLTYLLLNQPEKTLPYLEKGLNIAIELDIKVSIAVMNTALAKYYNTIKDHKKAYQHSSDALKFVTGTGNIELIRDAAEQNSISTAALNMYSEAYKSLALFKKMSDSIQNTVNKKQALVKEFKYKEEQAKAKAKIEHEVKDFEHQAELRQQQWLIYAASLAFIIVLVIALIIFRANLQRKRTNKILESQKNEIELNNKNINHSINYARRIQSAILPSYTELEQALGKENFFILYKPRNIVSGDFYWFADKDGLKIVAVADCTGHGVPGAFMSMVGNALLNHIVHDKEIHLPNLILSLMNKGLEKALHQTDGESIADAIEIALVTISSDRKLLISAAMSNIYLIQDDNLQIIKGDKLSIGGNSNKEKIFTQKQINITTKNATIYLFSDGYQDQFGGQHDKKFMSKQFRQLLFANHHKMMQEQQQIIDNTLTNWMMTSNKKLQTDDITVMGIRL
jgi:tetratricopeptide (TPR) repeat protein